MRVEAPNANYTGPVGRDTFANGVCEDASPQQEAYYRRKGYRIVGDVEKQPEDPGTAAEDRSDWKKADWLLAAGTMGLDVDEKDTVAEIKAAVAAHEAAKASEPTDVEE